MECSLNSPEEIAQCIFQVKQWFKTAGPWIELFLSVLGIGTVTLLTVHTWLLKRLRRDIETMHTTSQALKDTAKRAMEDKEKAEEGTRVSARNLERALEELAKARGPIDEQSARARSELRQLQDKLDLVRSASSEDGADFWTRPIGERLSDYSTRIQNSIPVLLFANQKGGVGKTTLSANLAACFAERGERVLAIDLDYQGSLTGLMLAQARKRPETEDDFPSTVDLLHARTLNEMWPQVTIEEGKAHSNLDYVSCWYSFERLERNMEYTWILHETGDDVRYRLARAVLSDHVQQRYDRVILDAPPRMTAGFINGFCAGTHLFVPTAVDRTSGIAVRSFAQQFRKLVPQINPVLKFAGIIGTMTSRDRLTQEAEPIADIAEESVRYHLKTNDDYFIRVSVVKHTPKISYSAENGIAYLQVRETRAMFDTLADEVARRAPVRRRRSI